MTNRVGLGIAAALAATCFYGTIPNFVRAAFADGVPAIESSFFRISLIAVVLAMAAVLRGESFALPRAGIPSFAGLALATLGVSVSYLVSVQFIPVGLAVIIFFTFPILILLLAPMIEGHSPGLLRIAVAVFAFAGLAIAVGPGFDGLDMRGIALAVAASLAAVLQFFSGRAISRHLDPLVFGSLVHLVIWLPMLAIILWFGSGTIRALSGEATGAGLLWVLALSLAYVGAYFFHMQSLKYAPASAVAPFFNLEPIVTTAIAVLLLGERLALNQYVGGAMVLAALLVSSILGLRRQRLTAALQGTI